MNIIDNYNPEVLKWARLRSGKISTKEFLEMVPKIKEWEEKKSFPTYIQLEKLADIYDLPLAVFFFPEPPDIELKLPDFQYTDQLIINELSNEIVKIITNARFLQESVKELTELNRIKYKNYFNQVSNLSYLELLEKTRELLNLRIEEQFKMDPETLLEFLRDKFFFL